MAACDFSGEDEWLRLQLGAGGWKETAGRFFYMLEIAVC